MTVAAGFNHHRLHVVDGLVRPVVHLEDYLAHLACVERMVLVVVNEARVAHLQREGVVPAGRRYAVVAHRRHHVLRPCGGVVARIVGAVEVVKHVVAAPLGVETAVVIIAVSVVAARRRLAVFAVFLLKAAVVILAVLLLLLVGLRPPGVKLYL